MTDTILVTGGNRGIGKATCEALAASGKRVLLGCRDLQQGRDVARNIPGDVIAVYLDFDDIDTVERQVEDILSRYPVVYGLVNNAAELFKGNLIEVSRADFYQSMKSNLYGPYEICRVLLKRMITMGHGRIVNVSSSWGAFSQGMEGPAAYSISKAALNAMTVSLCRGMPETIKVNAVDPGWVQTRMGGPDAPREPTDAIDTIVWLLNIDDNGPTGGFFHDKKRINW